MISKREIVIYADGFMKSKKERIGGCSVAVYTNDKEYTRFKQYFDTSVLSKQFMSAPPTNNTSEYFSLTYALYTARYLFEKAEDNNLKILIYIDSELLFKQMNDYAVCNSGHLRNMYIRCKKIYDAYQPNIFIQWVTRKKIVEILGH